MDWNRLLSTHRLRKSNPKPSVDDQRNSFESDFGRIIFSPAIRRMHDKTQVFPLNSDDNVHTRLTHSLEVQSVAHSIGVRICLNEDFASKFELEQTDLLRTIPKILESTAICHDIGNPPFGHYGEVVIQEYFKNLFQDDSCPVSLSEAQKKDFTHFDGNAQGFRILTRLQVLHDLSGLNLTVGTLASYLKYPFTSDEVADDKKNYQKKIGVFQSEKEILRIIRSETDLDSIRHPLSFLMEAADTICYITMDVEDGINKGYYEIDFVIDNLESNGDKAIREIINEFKAYFEKYYSDYSIDEKDTKNIALIKTVLFRVFTIQKLVDHACSEFLNNLINIEVGTYDHELIFSDSYQLGFALKNFAHAHIFRRRDIISMELAGESVIKGLLEHFTFDFLKCKEPIKGGCKTDKLMQLMSKSIRRVADYEENGSPFYQYEDYTKLRMIVDFITGMTDSFALNIYQRLKGITIG